MTVLRTSFSGGLYAVRKQLSNSPPCLDFGYGRCSAFFSSFRLLLVANTRPRYGIIGDIYDEPLLADACAPCDRHQWPWVCGAEFGWPWIYKRASLKEFHDLPFDYLEWQRSKPNYAYEEAHEQFVQFMPYFDRFDSPSLMANIGLGLGIVVFSGVVLERIKTVYLLSALAALGTTWITYQLYCADVKARNIEWLQDQGVEVRYDTGFDYDGEFTSDEKPAVSEWLVMCVGRERAHSLIHNPSTFVVTEDEDINAEIYDRVFGLWPHASIEVEESDDEPRHFKWDETLKRAVPIQ